MTAPAVFEEFGRAPTRRNTQKLANLPLQEQCCDVLNADLQLLTRELLIGRLRREEPKAVRPLEQRDRAAA